MLLSGGSSKVFNKDLQDRNRLFQYAAEQEFGRQRGGYGQQVRAGPPIDATVVENVSRPVWAADNLLLARRVDRGEQTEVQGSWLDWPRLKALLLEEAVDDPALYRAEDAHRDLLKGVGAGEGGLAPAEVALQDNDVGTVGLHEEAGDEELDADAGRDHPPAVEDARGCATGHRVSFEPRALSGLRRV